MATSTAKFRIDVDVHSLLNSNGRKPVPVSSRGHSLPEPIFPQYPEKLNDPGPERSPDGNRKWGVRPIYRAIRGWLMPYVRSRVMPGDFHPCRNNLDDVKMLTEFAHDHQIATDYHMNETPMLEQDEHFKHLNENPTYFRREDWRDLDTLIDWIIEKNKAGYQMVNSVQRLEEMKTFVRMSSGLNLHDVGWYGDGNGSEVETAEMLKKASGVVQGNNGDLRFAEWNCRAGQNNVIIRTDGTVAPCFPTYSATFDWGNIDHFTFNRDQLYEMKTACQKQCFSTLNHNLAYCYNDARVIKWMWQNVKRGFQGGMRSFED